jgi:hypothetical protein
MGAVENLKTSCCLGLPPERAIIAVMPLLYEIIGMADRASGCASPMQRWAAPTAKIRKDLHAAFPHSAANLLAVSVLFVFTGLRAGPMSLRDRHRTFCKLHDAIRAVSDHPLVQCRMACRPNDEQIRVEIGGKLDNIAHRMPRHDPKSLRLLGSCARQSAAFPLKPCGLLAAPAVTIKPAKGVPARRFVAGQRLRRAPARTSRKARRASCSR